jgi:hypothetical protein
VPPQRLQGQRGAEARRRQATAHCRRRVCRRSWGLRSLDLGQLPPSACAGSMTFTSALTAIRRIARNERHLSAGTVARAAALSAGGRTRPGCTWNSRDARGAHRPDRRPRPLRSRRQKLATATASPRHRLSRHRGEQRLKLAASSPLSANSATASRRAAGRGGEPLAGLSHLTVGVRREESPEIENPGSGQKCPWWQRKADPGRSHRRWLTG